LTALLWDSSRIYTTELKEKQLVRLKGEAKLTKSEKTAPIDMLRTISSSSSVSDIVPDLLVDELIQRETE
jgi:23S rRNA maturation-related 3'-5' exoribonuclease YhaM